MLARVLRRRKAALVGLVVLGLIGAVAFLAPWLTLYDPIILMYLIHTLEVPDELRDGAVATARRRYSNYLRAVDRKLAKEDPGAGAATAAQERQPRTGELDDDLHNRQETGGYGGHDQVAEVALVTACTISGTLN